MSEIRGALEGVGRRFAIIVSRYNDLVTERLLNGARSCLLQHGVAEADVEVIAVPGAWELPGAALVAAHTGRFAGIVALGCVIRGETPHFDYVAGEAARGLASLVLETGVPVGFGLLTTEDPEQALARAGGSKGNKGWEAALSALEMADLYAQLRGGHEGA
jgi:6,7-dimethyl-8-ribityllumazine synthase